MKLDYVAVNDIFPHTSPYIYVILIILFTGLLVILCQKPIREAFKISMGIIYRTIAISLFFTITALRLMTSLYS
jgi:hypothetical protein